MRLTLSTLAISALTHSASAAFVGITAEVQNITIGGQPHAIIELFATYDDPANTTVNVFNANYLWVNAPTWVHFDSPQEFPGPDWSPKWSLPFGDQNPSDSLVRIGGLVSTGGNGSQQATFADPNFGSDGFAAPTIPPGAGWANGNPPNGQGTAGADLKTPLSRHVVSLANGDVTLNCSGSMTSLTKPFGQGGTSFGSTFNVTFVIEAPAEAPENDACSAAQPISGSGTTAFDTELATTDGPPQCADSGNDIWFAYTPSVVGGTVHMTLPGSDFDTVLSVYAGCGNCPPDGGQLVACNDDAQGGVLWSEVWFDVSEAGCFLVQISGAGGATGSGVLTIGEPADCNGNGVSDQVDIENGAVDCDLNGQPDSCQLAGGDVDGNGVLDICETLPGVVAGPIVNPANCHRYYLLAKSNWTLSQEAAEALGGTLAIVNDEAENTWIWDTFSPASTELWIGLSDVVEEGVFVWTDGSPVTYSNWGPGEPNNAGNENFVHVWSVGGPGRWNDNRNVMYFVSGVVEIDAGSPDLNGDRIVDGADLGELLSAWGDCEESCPADLDCNGIVDGADLGILLSAWG